MSSILKYGTKNFILFSEKQETISRSHKSLCLPLDHQGSVMVSEAGQEVSLTLKKEKEKKRTKHKHSLAYRKRLLSILTVDIQSRKSILLWYILSDMSW